jgi:eukaryotic-like serine/threonine-protein kinase
MSGVDGSPGDLPTSVTSTGGGTERVSLQISQIGRYKITRLIGEGGMGVVYEAEQDQPRRTVALKVIKPGLASPELLRRFAQESQALGRLQHAGIAQIYEAGTADAGYGPQPYFAMEFIRGETLRDYAENHHLNTRQRLEIVAKICDAVHHAHHPR